MNSGAAGRCAVANMLFAPFRPRTSHIVIFRLVLPVRPIPGRTEKRQHGTNDLAQEGNKSGYGERNLSHVALRTKKMNPKWRARDGPPPRHERSVDWDLRIQLSSDGSR